MLVMQNNGNGAVVRLYDKITNPFFLLFSVISITNNKTNSTSFEDIMVRYFRMLRVCRLLVGGDLPCGLVDHLGIPD